LRRELNMIALNLSIRTRHLASLDLPQG